MDWYLVAWVAGAILTWVSLERSSSAKKISTPFFVAVVVLWFLVWVIGAVAGLVILAQKLAALFQGRSSGTGG